MHPTLRELHDRILTPPRLLIWGGTTIICTLSGPFGTLLMLSPSRRLLFWAVAVGCAVVLANVVLLTSDVIARRVALPLRPLIEALAFGVVFTLLLKVVLSFTLPETANANAPLWFLFLQTSGIFLVVVWVKDYVRRPEPVDPQEVGFFKRLPARLGTDLMWVSSQDHYVEAQTERGRELILMRFSDALAELDGVDGLRVHRSHWIARSAIDAVEKKNGKTVVRLKDGTRVPVSRSYKEAMRDAGLL